MTDWKPIPNQLDRVAQIVLQANSAKCVEISWMFQRYPEQPDPDSAATTEANTDQGRDAAPDSDPPAGQEIGEAEA